MKKHKLLPILAITGMAKNKELYSPYLGAGIFSAFLYFTFDSIIHHPIMGSLPRAAYAHMIMLLGFILLHVIMLPFLHYTYRFLIKRRKKEIGLYSILGMEKKHIAGMMIYESIIATLLMVLGGVLLGSVFARLVFMIFFYMMDLPVLNDFPFSLGALRDTAIFFVVSAACNLTYSLYSVGKLSPVELMSSSRKGEKNIRFIGLFTVVGLIILAVGYKISITARFDSTIFTDFFVAVLLVVIATYFLITTASVALLGFLRKRKGFYYKPDNFITISGMYYRMKRSAAGLVNICIFSTMVIITLTCTAALYLGTDSIMAFMCPYDVKLVMTMENDGMDVQRAEEYIREKEAAYGMTEEFLYVYPAREGYFKIEDTGAGYSLSSAEGMNSWDEGVECIEILTLSDYNRITGQDKKLEENELLIYSDGANINRKQVTIFDEPYTVKEELASFPATQKTKENIYRSDLWIVIKDTTVLPEEAQSLLHQESLRAFLRAKETAGEKEAFAAALCDGVSTIEYRNCVEKELDLRSMYGGLLFIGVFFGLLFTICLVIIMYYKQISEGYEDRGNFEIMQKVGMSHVEIRATIAKQILLVFFIPIFGAVCHVCAATPMMTILFISINLFDSRLIVLCSAGALAVFLLFYGISYMLTAKTYMKIVEKRG